MATIDHGAQNWDVDLNKKLAELQANEFKIIPITLTGLNGWSLNGTAFYAANGVVQINELDFIATPSAAVEAGKLQDVIIGKLGNDWPEWTVAVVGNWKDATTQMFTIENHNEIHLHSLGNLVSAGNGLHLHQTAASAV